MAVKHEGGLGFEPILDATPLWRKLWTEIHDHFAPPPEPELQLESKPIPVKDIWSRPAPFSRRAGSLALHAAIVGILMLPFWRPIRTAVQKQVEMLPTLYEPGPSLPKMHRLAGGGAPVHVIAPKLVQPVNAPPQPVTPPVALVPTAAVPYVDLASLGNIGAIAGPPGNSAGTSGKGPGGAGADANGGGDCVNGACGGGGDVTQPVPIYEPDPEYSNAAREAKFQGTCIVSVIIGADGHVYDPKVVQPLGLGLDEKAIEAVKLWRFEPARHDGRPVRVAANIEVNFHLY